MIAWIRKWLFTLALSLALLIPFSVWTAKMLAWSLFNQSWDLWSPGYGLLMIAVVVLLIVALVAIVYRPVPQKPGKKMKHYVLLLATLALNVICWGIVWNLMFQSFS